MAESSRLSLSALPGKQSVRWCGRHKLLVGLLGFIVATIACCGIAAGDFLDPTYAFPFDSLSNPADVRLFQQTARELRQARSWEPECTSDAHLRALGEVLALPENQSCARLEELLRGPGAAGQSSLNSTILFLAERIPARELAALRALSPEARLARLRQLADAEIGDRRARAIRHVLETGTFRARLQDYDATPLPTEMSWLRRQYLAVRGQPNRDRDRWIDAYLTACKLYVEPTAELYARIQEQSHLDLGEGERLLLRPQRDPEAFHFAGTLTTVDTELWLRLPGSGTQTQDIDTGLRLFRVRYELPAGQGGMRPRRDRLPAPVVLPEQAARLLHSFGLPPSFALKDIRATITFPEGRPVARLSGTLFPRDLPEATTPIDLDLSEATTAADLETLITATCKRIEQDLREYLLQLTKYQGVPVAVRAAGDTYVCTATLDGGCRVELPLRLRPDGRLHWGETPEAASQFALANHLAARTPELQDLGPLVQLERVRLAGSPSRVSGSLRVRGKSVGCPSDLEGVTWSLPVQGPAQFHLNREATAYLADCRGRLRRGTPAPVTAEEVARAAHQHIQNRYPTLAGAVRLDARAAGSVVLLRLGLDLDDYPALDLGTTEVPALAEVPALVDRHFAEKHVLETARVQYRPDLAHPKHGQVRVALAHWSPEPAQAKFRCRWDLPAVGRNLEWEESLTRQENRWLAMAEEAICQQLEPLVKEIEEGIGAAAAKVGLLLGLKVRRDAFGPGRWVRLSPPAICLDGHLTLPWTNLRVDVRGVQLTDEGLVWPESELRICYHSTVPLSHVAISDPALRVRLPREHRDRLLRGDWRALGNATLLIEAKLTPPTLPLTAILPGVEIPPEKLSPESLTREGSPLSDTQLGELLRAYRLDGMNLNRLRLDNLWLHVAYLEVQLGGQLNQPEFQAHASLHVLDNYRIAEGDLRCRFDRLDIRGRMKAQSVPGSSSFRLEGEMGLAASEGLWVDGQFNAFGVSARGRFHYDATTIPAQLSIRGEIHFPLDLGECRCRGWAKSVQFDDYEVQGDVIPPAWFTAILFPPNAVGVRGIVTPRGFAWEYIFETEKGRETVRIEVGYATDDALEHLKEAVARLERQPAQPPSPAEHVIVERQLGPVTTPAPGNETKPEGKTPPVARTILPRPVELAPAPASGRTSTEPPPTFSFGEESVVKIADGWLEWSSPALGKVLRIRAADAQIDAVAGKHLFLWHWEKRRTIVCFDFEKRQVRVVCCPDAGSVSRVLDVTARLTDLEPLFPAADTNGRELHRWQAAEAAVFAWGQYVTEDLKAAPPRQVQGGYLLAAPVVEGSPTLDEFFWANDSGAHRVFVWREGVQTGRGTDAVFTRLMLLTRNDLSIVITAEDADVPRLAISGMGRDKNQVVLYLDPHRADAVPVQMDMNDELSVPVRLQLSRWLVQAAWTHNLPLAGCKAVRGPQGLIVPAGQNLWLFPASRVRQEKPAWTEKPPSLARARLVQWPADTVRFLPPELQSSQARQNLELEALARQVVADWQQTRRTETWGANPMGLLLDLAAWKEPAGP